MINQIDLSFQYFRHTRPEASICARAPLNLIEGCPKVSRITGINEQRAIPKGYWGLSDGPWRLSLLKSTILTEYVALRVKRPIFVRVPAESYRRVP
jgi:hypothetical protein